MSRKKKAKPDTDIEMNMTPMIDIVFQLLIFFIVNLKFKTLEKKLLSYLPTDFGLASQPQIVEESFMTVKLQQPLKSEDNRRIMFRKTRFYIERDRIEGVDTRDIHSQIFTRLKDFIGVTPDAKGKIDASKGVPHGYVVSVLDVFRKAGYKTITFVGLAKNAKINNEWFLKIQKGLEN